MKFVKRTWNAGIAGKIAVGCGSLLVLSCLCGALVLAVAPRSSTPPEPAIDVDSRDATSIARQIATINANKTQAAPQAQPQEDAAQPVVSEATQPPPAPMGEPVSFEEIRSKNKELTGVQWREYTEQTQGKYADRWVGWVEEVSDSGGYHVRVDMDPPDSLSVSDVEFPTDKDTAFRLQKDQQIVFSGRIKTVQDILGVRIDLEGATIDFDAQPGEARSTQQAASAPTTKLGDTVEKDGYSLSATAIQDPCAPSIIYEPKEGKRVIGVEIVLGNVSGAEPLSINPLYATLIDTEGYTYDPELGGCEEQIATGDLNPGEKVRGIVGFELPVGAMPASIRYRAGIIDGVELQVGVTQ